MASPAPYPLTETLPYADARRFSLIGDTFLFVGGHGTGEGAADQIDGNQVVTIR